MSDKKDQLARLAALRDKYFANARDTPFQEQLDRLLVPDATGAPTAEPLRLTRTGETRGILVTGAPGSGKTALVNRTLVRHPALKARPINARAAAPAGGADAGSLRVVSDDGPFPVVSDDGPLRVVSVEVPSPASMKSLALEILCLTDYPVTSGRQDAWALWKTVRHRFALRGTCVLWIDEAHDLFRAGTATADMLGVLKSLMQTPGVILILSGIDRLGQIAAVDPQLDRRLTKVVLPPVAEATDGDLLWNMLAHCCAAVGVAPPARGDLVGRLIHGARAQFGRALELIHDALEQAIRAGDATLDIRHFAAAYAMKEGCKPADNVFLAPNWAQIQPGAAAAPAPAPRTRRKSR
jgi:hypothetical protein